MELVHIKSIPVEPERELALAAELQARRVLPEFQSLFTCKDADPHTASSAGVSR